tara:strand:- start:259 stop:495 length:237 start_codon:yes stop_codon:yes gene_type:complete
MKKPSGLIVTQKFHEPILIRTPNDELIRVVPIRTVGSNQYKMLIDAPSSYKIDRDIKRQSKMKPIHIGHEPQTGVYDH